MRDGFFSFEAERLGAARVVALDHFAWEHDVPGIINQWRESTERGVAYEAATTESFYRPQELPGKVGFDTAHRILSSRVETVIADFSAMEVSTLGKFDVVLFLGVLYHLENPLAALKKLRQVTWGIALIETEAMYIPQFEERALCEFFPGSELNNDPSNWWSPNERALTGMCRAREELVSLLRELKSQGKRIAVYGASAKGSTLLNHFGVGRELLDFVADRSTVKQGHFTPGTHLPIHAPERLLEDMPDYVLLLTWNFAQEILEQQREYRERGGRFIVPIPEVRII